MQKEGLESKVADTCWFLVPRDAILSLDEEFLSVIKLFHLPSVSSVCDLLLCSGAVISGSAALALFFPGAFLPRDLDIYVASYGAARVIAYLHDHAYRIDPLYSPGAGIYDNGAVVFKLSHEWSTTEINVVIYREDNFVNHIAKFHSTIVMNYVSWYGLVCLYPNWTLQKKGLITVDNLVSRPCIKKYENRGFVLLSDNKEVAGPSSAHICGMTAECPETTRDLHDDGCAFQPFEGHRQMLAAYETAFTWNLPGTCTYST